MRKGLTELVFIIDRSGSMHGLEADTIGASTRCSTSRGARAARLL